MRALLTLIVGVAAAVGALLSPTLVDACAGLIGSNGAVNLGRTSTLAAYSDGVEHYVTAFEFQGGGGEFGTLIPLPGVPTKVERGGAWTLQRLELETQPPADAFAERTLAFAGAAYNDVRVIQEVRIDALDITVLEGGGPAVATWAQEHGFRLSPDAPEVLDFYARRSPIFLAAVFDGDAAAERGQQLGDGTPVHLTIPTDNPWVPLRILGLGKQPDDRIEADVYLLTDDKPSLLPSTGAGIAVTHDAPARATLLDDLRSDDGMGWVPERAWLTKMAIDSATSDLVFDLAVDASGEGRPSFVDAGLQLPLADNSGFPYAALVAAAGMAALLVLVVRLQPRRAEQW
jgi:hypothetical protein